MTRRIRAAVAAAILIFCFPLAGCADETETTALELSASSTERTVSVSWDSVEDADRFRLFKKTGERADFRFVCDVTDAFSYTDEYVEKDTEYVYKIKAYNGASVIAEGSCAPICLAPSPAITSVRQIEGQIYEVEWDNNDKVCIVYGRSSSDWYEIGRSEDGVLRFENTNSCTELSVASDGKDAIRSAAVSFVSSGSVLAATALDGWTNAIEVDLSDGDWRCELARSETKDGEYTVVGSAKGSVFYDVKEEENTTPYWYRFRLLGDRFEGAWSEPMQLGTNARDVFYVPVILYHEFLPEKEWDGTIEFKEDVITPEEFESDLIWLKEHGYSAITTSELIEYFEGGGSLPEKPIIISIDDGKYGVYKWAWPLLNKHGMKASLAVIGSMIDSATASPATRDGDAAPYCTWDEIAEMSASGSMEIISHTQSMHVFSHDGRQGANVAEGETSEQYLSVAVSDAKSIMSKIEKATGSTPFAMAYPYSVRSVESDIAWRGAGYKLLLCGNDDSVSRSKWNPLIREAGLNVYSSRLRRIGRITGTPVGRYLGNYEEFLAQNRAD